jgi:hypothetical protein
MKSIRIALIGLILTPVLGMANVAVFLEEPFGTFGGMNPTGHAAIYLSRVCADSMVSLRHCDHGEAGVVISRYHRLAGYDWIAMPLIPYLYAVDRADQIPAEISPEQEATLRDNYRRRYLREVAPDGPDGSMPDGEWIQLVGSAYDRTIYTFEIATTRDQDDRFIEAFNDRANKSRFNLFFHNCADFTRQAVNFYFPKALQRNFTADVGIMTPKEAAKDFVRYAKRHPELEFSSFTIPQVPGTVPRSRPVRGVLESLVKSKRYVVPLGTLAILQPYVGGGLALAWIGSDHFNPGRVAGRDSDPFEARETFAPEPSVNNDRR